MTQLSISVLNDWADRGYDARAGRRKPLVVGHTSPRLALGLAVLFALCAIPGALAYGRTAGVVLVIGMAAGFAYDLWLKPTPLSFLPFAVAFPLLPTWVALVAGRRVSELLWVIAGGALLATAVHLSDALPDLSSDASSGVHSLAVSLGFEQSVRAIIACLLAGDLVIVAALASRWLAAVLVGVSGLLAAALIIRVARATPQRARWISAAYAVVSSVALLSRLPHG